MADSTKKYSIKATVLLENRFWIALFERNDDHEFAVARHIFGSEPTDAELYEFVLTHLNELKFTETHQFTLIIKRKNYKRVQRDVKKELAAIKNGAPKITHAQEVLRIDLEKNKKLKKTQSKQEREALLDAKFLQKQAKKKEKLRGH